jgi:hypothetical protein
VTGLVLSWWKASIDLWHLHGLEGGVWLDVELGGTGVGESHLTRSARGEMTVACKQPGPCELSCKIIPPLLLLPLLVSSSLLQGPCCCWTLLLLLLLLVHDFHCRMRAGLCTACYMRQSHQTPTHTAAAAAMAAVKQQQQQQQVHLSYLWWAPAGGGGLSGMTPPAVTLSCGLCCSSCCRV